MKKRLRQFLDWAFAPLTDSVSQSRRESAESANSLSDQVNDIGRLLEAMEARQSSILTARMDESLAAIRTIGAMFEAASVEAERREANYPRLTIGALMAFEAVSYARTKWEKDQTPDRIAEIFQWTCAYCRESDWPVLDADTFHHTLMLADKIAASRKL